MSSISTPKTHTAGSGLSEAAKGSSLRRRRTKLVSEKRIADDEFMAAAIGDVEWLKQSLKDAGTDINFDKNGLTSIHLAAIHGRLDCLKVCIEKFKIDINLPSSTGWRAVHLCISNQTGKRSLGCLAYLLEKGADHSVANDDGITPVHQAASEGHVYCLKMLLEVGARLDKKDCRGNTPLDLAKLWGHRKCARILAAEMWHQDKDNVAKEMLQLKKVKMQQILKQLEDEEEEKSAKQFYGEDAFKQWMENKNLSQKTMTEKLPLKHNKETGYKPNSVAKNTGRSNSLNMDTDKQKSIPNNEEQPMEISNEELPKDQINETEKSMESEKSKMRQLKPLMYNENDWVKSTKTPKKSYITNLTDDFPRDEYTKMPLVKGAPKFYEGKFVRPMTPKNVDKDIIEKGTDVKLRKPNLPDEIIKKTMAKDSSAIDRGQLFKCKHIGDVHTKKKYDMDTKGWPEAPLHLSNNVKSQMIKNSIKFLNIDTCHHSKSNSSSKTASNEWMTDTFPLPLVMQSLKQISKPAHFINSNSDEYVFAFGGVK